MSRRAWLLFVAVSFLWGIPYYFIKVALDGGVAPLTVALVRVAIGAAVLLPLAVARGELRGLVSRWRPLVAVAVLDVAGPFVLVAVAEQTVSSSVAGILVSSTPLFVALLALRTDPSERFSGRRVIGLVLGFAGVAVLFGVDWLGSEGFSGGALLVVLASLGYAAATLIVKRCLADLPPVGVTTVTLGLSVVLLAAPAAAAAEAFRPRPAVLLTLLVLGAACTGAAFLAYYALVGAAGADRAAVITYVAPGFAVVLGVTLLDEPFSARIGIGLALILVGSWLSTRYRAGEAAGEAQVVDRPGSADAGAGVGNSAGHGR